MNDDETETPPEYDLNLDALERDCEMTFVRVSGPGGQHKNKRDTGVRLVHGPSGVVVTATERRSQSQNRALAYERMAEKLAEKMHRDPDRVPTKVPRAVTEQRLELKRRQSVRKSTRRDPIVLE